MIKIIAFILYQTHIETSGFTNPVLNDLMAGGKRNMTGVEMAEYMTNVLKDHPATEWKDLVEEMNVPSYEKSVSALVLTLLEQMEQTGFITNFVTSDLMSSMGVPAHEIDFLKNEFTANLKIDVSEWNSRNDNYWKKPDPFNTFVALLRAAAAFPFQEDMKTLKKSHLSFFNWIIEAVNKVSESEKVLSLLEKFNKNLDHFSTLPEIEPTTLNRREICPIEARNMPVRKIELFPGYQRCKKTNDHSLWHAQSARGIVDFFQLADEFARKQTDYLNPPDFDKITKEAEAAIKDTYSGVMDETKEIGKKISDGIDNAHQGVVDLAENAHEDVFNLAENPK